MNRQVVVVEPGQGDRVGNVEFLARTIDTPYFNPGIAGLKFGQGVDGHRHAGEDHFWLVLFRGHAVGSPSATSAGCSAPDPVRSCGSLRGPIGVLVNDGPEDVRFLNIHSPGGFPRRIGLAATPPSPAQRG